MSNTEKYGQSEPSSESSRTNWWASLKTRLIIIILGASIVPLVFVGLITYYQSQKSLLEETQSKLEAVRSLKAARIQQYFAGVKQDIQSVARLEVVNKAHRAISSAASQIVGLEEVHNSGFLGDPARTMSEKFNPYDLAHKENYDLLAQIIAGGGYADLMLVNGVNGDIIYTYAKNDDFATNLQNGPYSDTHLAAMVRQIMAEKEAGKVYMTDFAHYAPADNTPVSFVGTYLDNNRVSTNGILIYELAIDEIDRLMKDQTGLDEKAGETYLVGADYKMRSNSPLASGDTFFGPEVDNAVVRAGLEGKTGFVKGIESYRGVTVLSAYQPINMGDFQWVLVAEMEQDAALQSARNLRNWIIIFTIFIAVIVGGLGLWVALRISDRIGHLTVAARRIIGGDFMVQVPVEGRDETGELAEAFSTMTAQLRELIGSLERQVAERTRGLETVVEISQQLAGILEVSDLMHQVVVLTKERFDYYHVHIYLADETNEKLVMAEGYGQAGAEMKRQGHTIALRAEKSLVAQATRQHRIVLVQDVREYPEWLPNELLPETRAEMAVPIISGTKVLGVLDVQSNQVDGLTNEDGVVLRALANQVAVALRNAESFAETQQALNEAEKLQRLYTGQAWERFGATRPTSDYEIRQAVLPPIGQITTPEAVTAAQHKQTVGLRIGSDGWPGADEGIEAAIATPLKIGDEIIGVLGVRDANPDRRWTEEETALIEAVSEQMSLALENARLFEETGRRAGRERIIADVTRQIWASGELDYVMRTAVEQLGKTLDASKVVLRLGTEDRLVITPNGSDNTDDLDPTGQSIVSRDDDDLDDNDEKIQDDGNFE